MKMWLFIYSLMLYASIFFSISSVNLKMKMKTEQKLKRKNTINA